MNSIEDALRIASRARNEADDVTGLLASRVAGRTDDHMISVRDGSYVIPADVVSSLGEGNTEAGAAELEQMFFDEPEPRASGGPAPKLVDIAAAGGEYIVPPAAVRRIGGGDMVTGHAILDALVKQQRQKTVETLKKLPGPKT